MINRLVYQIKFTSFNLCFSCEIKLPVANILQIFYFWLYVHDGYNRNIF